MDQEQFFNEFGDQPAAAALDKVSVNQLYEMFKAKLDQDEEKRLESIYGKVYG